MTWTHRAADFSGGYNSYADPTTLQDNELQAATNVVLDNGTPAFLATLSSAIATGLTGAQRAIYKVGNNWIGSTTAVAFWAPINGNVAYVVTGEAPPQYSNGTTTRNLGLALPTTGPTVGDSGSGAGPAAGSVTYYLEYQDDLGQRSGLSDGTTQTSTGHTMNLTGIPTSPTTGVTTVNIYRSNGSAIQFVDSIDNGTDTYDDSLTELELGDTPLGATMLGGVAPNLQGIAGVHVGRLWGWVGTRLYFSELGAPGIWPATYYIDMPDTVQNVLSIGPTTLLVLTTSAAHLLFGSGVTDANGVFDFNRHQPEQIYGCDAPHSLLRTDYGIFFWSNQGLVRASAAGFELVTERKLSKADVAAIEADAANLRAGYWRGQYILFGTSGGWIFDLRHGYIAKTDQTVDAVHTNTDALYIQSGASTYQWGAGSGARAITLRTKAFTPAADRNALAYTERVLVQHNGTFTVRLYLDGVQHGSDQTVTRASMGPSLVWFPNGAWGSAHAVELVGGATTDDQVDWLIFNPPDMEDAA